MARADRRRAAREAARKPRTSRAMGGAHYAEDTLFFPGLRAHAKWVFVLLIVVFAGGFVFLGVGSGSGIGDVLGGNIGNLFSGGSSTGDQVKSAKSKIKKNPKNLQAYRDLASAYRTENKTDDAILAYNQLLDQSPKDVDALGQLAGLYLAKGDAARTRAQTIQAQSPGTAGQDFAPPSTSKLGQALQGSADPTTRWDPINQSVTDKINKESADAYSEMTTAYNNAVGTYKRLAGVTPKDASVWFQLGTTAETAGDAKTAAEAYAKFLKLAPDDPTAPAVRQHLKQLQKQLSQTSASTAG